MVWEHSNVSNMVPREISCPGSIFIPIKANLNFHEVGPGIQVEILGTNR